MAIPSLKVLLKEGRYDWKQSLGQYEYETSGISDIITFVYCACFSNPSNNSWEKAVSSASLLMTLICSSRQVASHKSMRVDTSGDAFSSTYF